MVLSSKEEKGTRKPTQTATREILPRKESSKKSFINFIKEDRLWQKRLILIVVSILSALILSPQITTPTFKLKEGDIARQNYKANRDLLVEDKLSTNKKREAALLAALAVYDFDETAPIEIRMKIELAFSTMRQNLLEIENKASETIEEKEGIAIEKREKTIAREIVAAYLEESKLERLSAFREKLGVTIEEEDFRRIENRGFSKSLEEIVTSVIIPIMGKRVLESKEHLPKDKDKGLIVRSVKSQKEIIVKDASSFLSLAEARDQATKTIQAFKGTVDKKLLASTLRLASLFLGPNLTFNKNETEERKNALVSAVSPVFIQIKEGEMILREGERVKRDQIIKLNALVVKSEKESNYLKLAGLALLVAFILYIVYQFSSANIRKVALNSTDLLFLGILFISLLGVCKLSIPLTNAFAGAFPYIPIPSYQYFFTAAVGAMLVRIVLNSEVALIFSILVGLMVAMIMKDSLIFGIYTFIGSVVGAQMVRFCKTRVSLFKAGFYVGLANVAMIIIFGMAYGEVFNEIILYSMFVGFTGGIVTGIVVTGIVPIVEGLFGYTTNFNLLELASLDHPLLKELITQAPGTYHHSWIIGNLVEPAAKAIDANPLFARVSSLYHDVGKMKKPQYFSENQKGEKNPHDKLSPSLSSLILIGHVKDGLELAREYKIGKRIQDIIPQHHGTRLIKFFYNKAKELEDPDMHTVNEKDFRYPGPKPQTKEAGLVMLADAVEAACRTIQDPSTARIKSAVQKIIGDVFADGQLDECELTLKDLNLIAQSFNTVLNGIYHTRIEYPEPVVKEDAKIKDENGTYRNKKEDERGKKEGDREDGEEHPRAIKLERRRT